MILVPSFSLQPDVFLCHCWLECLHFNRGGPLSQSFMRFCWLHYLFSTNPLFANVLMSESDLFVYCCRAVWLNEYASLTIHHIMHIWSSQFKDNSSCHSHADLWYKDTFHWDLAFTGCLPFAATISLSETGSRGHTFRAFLRFCELFSQFAELLLYDSCGFLQLSLPPLGFGYVTNWKNLWCNKETSQYVSLP